MGAQSKVVHFFSSSSGYRWFLDQVLTLRATGVDVECIVGGEGWLAERLRANGVRTYVFDLSVPWSLNDLHDWRSRVASMSALVRFLRERKYDVAQFHLFESAVIGRLSAFIAGIPVRIRMNETPAYLDSAGGRAIEIALQKLDTHTVASSDLIRNQYLSAGLSDDALSVAYYGASSNTFSGRESQPAFLRDALRDVYGIPASGPLIGMVAHFYAERPCSDFTAEQHWDRPVKLHELFIESSELVLKERPDAIFVMAGEPCAPSDEIYYQRIRRQVEDRGLSKSVFFTGMVTDVEKLIGCLDLSVQCSSFDNLGGALESMAMGCPIIATDVGAFAEAIVPDNTGILVDTNADSLSRAILRCLAAPAETKAMGLRGQNHVASKFTAEHAAAKLRTLYELKSPQPLFASSSLMVLIRAICVLPLCARVLFRLCRRDLHARWSQITVHRCARQFMNLLKRFGDVLGSSVLLALASPLILLVVSWHLVSRSSRPLFFRYLICGRNNRSVTIRSWCPLQLTEFNVLAPFDEAHGSRDLKGLLDSVRYKLWWLPLMLSVFLGRISIVGPCFRVAGFETAGQSWQVCRPGIFGWTQSCEVASSTEAELRDSLYAVSFSPLLDLKILCKALVGAFRRKSFGAVAMQDEHELRSDVRESVV